MVNLNILMTEEKEELCKLIGGEKFKEGFRRFPKKFNTIKSGFRPQSLSEAKCCDIALKNIDKPFISEMMTSIATAEIEGVRKKYKKCIKDGRDKGEAAFIALRSSFFVNRLNIYFRLAEHKEADIYMDMINWFFEKSSEVAERHKEELREMGELRERIEELENHLAKAQKDADQKDKELKQSRSESSSLLDKVHEQGKTIGSLKERITDLEEDKKSSESELSDLQEKNAGLQRELEEISDRTFSNDELHMSFCEVKEGNKGPFLYRISDIQNGEIIGELLPEIPYTYTSLYGRFLPPQGTLGVWYWKERENEYGRFFIDNQDEAFLKPIQAIMVDREEVVRMLKDGVKLNPDCDSFIFAWTKDRNGYEGIVCAKGQFERNGDVYCLKSDVYELPVYSFSGQPFFRYNDLWFYRKFYLGKPESFLVVSNPDDVIKNLLMKRLSRSDLKQGKLDRQSFKHLRMLSEKMMVPSFYEEVENACDCTLEEAEQYVHNFVEKSEKHISGSDIANRVISEVIENHGELKAKAYKLAADKWQEENKVIIDEKEKELQVISGQVESSKEELSRLIMDKDAAEKSIREKKSFLDSLEKEVKSRMEKAQTDVSAFLVDMMMKHGLSSSNAAGDEKAERKEESPLFQSGQAWDGDSFNYDNLDDVLNNLIENLESAGVNLDDAKALAPCFYSAYINHVPLILAGPNGKNIADAVSITMGNRKAGNMDCRGDYNPEAIEQCKSSEDKVITVTNPFNSRWAPYLPELLDSDRLTLLLVPYSEELTLEMKSLYNFALPLVTDFVIHKKAAEEEFIGGQIYSELIEDHKDYHMDTRWTSMLRKYHVEGMTEYWIKLLLKDWIPYVKNKEDIWYRFFMYPYAYATGNLEKMSQYVNDRDNDLSNETKKLFKEDGESE